MSDTLRARRAPWASAPRLRRDRRLRLGGRRSVQQRDLRFAQTSLENLLQQLDRCVIDIRQPVLVLDRNFGRDALKKVTADPCAVGRQRLAFRIHGRLGKAKGDQPDRAVGGCLGCRCPYVSAVRPKMRSDNAHEQRGKGDNQNQDPQNRYEDEAALIPAIPA